MGDNSPGIEESKEPWRLYLVILFFALLVGNIARTILIARAAHYIDYLEQTTFRFIYWDIPNGFSVFNYHIYQPFAWQSWVKDELLLANMPDILKSYSYCTMVCIALALFLCYAIHKKSMVLNSHGTARFADNKDIKKQGLQAKNGVVCGRNPFNDKMLLHDGPEHIFLAAPTRTGKGVGVIIPTGIVWKHSIFFFDPKSELWHATSGFRQKKLKQKVMRFEPLCDDGSAARWNPYAEVNFQSFEEFSDITTINETIVKTGEGGNNKDPFWDNSAISVLNGVALHLMYKNCQEKLPLPCPTDIYSFLSSPGLSTDQIFSEMMVYPHISPREFLEDRCKNPLREVYGVYYTDFLPIVEYLQSLKENSLSTEEYKSIMDRKNGENPTEELENAFENLRLAIVKRKDEISWKSPLGKIRNCKDKKEIEGILSTHKFPLYKLLVHPKVAESAANILKGANETRQSILSSATTPLGLYQDPLIRKNTCVSDFCMKDLLNPKQEVSLYMVLQPDDVDKLRPLTRLFVNTLIAKSVTDMKFDPPPPGQEEKKQRLLLMLDEFPQLKKMETIGNTLAICAGYGVKICTVVQNITQLNEIYTKDGTNKILSNSQVQIYMTPSDIETAEVLSKTLGEKTIQTQSFSSNGAFKGGSTSTSQSGRNLMKADEILRMEKDTYQLVLVQGGKPILAKKIRWYKEKFFQKRVYDARNLNEFSKKFAPPIISDTCTEVKDYTQLFAINLLDAEDMKKRQFMVAKAKETKEANCSIKAEEKSAIKEEEKKNSESKTDEANIKCNTKAKYIKQENKKEPAVTGTEQSQSAHTSRTRAADSQKIVPVTEKFGEEANTDPAFLCVLQSIKKEKKESEAHG